MALLRSPRFSHSVIACILGIVACGVSFALAGPTPKPPASPLDNLPPGVAIIRNLRAECVADVASAVMPTQPASDDSTTTTTLPTDCWTVAFVRAPDATPNELADRLALYFAGRGFEFAGSPNGETRSYSGINNVCGTVLAIDTGVDGLNLKPGLRASLPSGFDLTNPATTTVTIPPPGAIAGNGITAADPALTSPLPPAPAPSTDATVADTATAPSSLPGSITSPAELYELVTPTRKGGGVIVSVRQPRSVVPHALEGRC